MNKVVIITYLFLLSLLSLISISASYYIDTTYIFATEVIVDIIFIFGVIFYYKRLFLKAWGTVFLFALTGEIILLITDSRSQLVDISFWILILSPAIYMNIRNLYIFSPHSVSETET